MGISLKVQFEGVNRRAQFYPTRGQGSTFLHLRDFVQFLYGDALINQDFSLFYHDEEDEILIGSDLELEEAISFFGKLPNGNSKLHVKVKVGSTVCVGTGSLAEKFCFLEASEEPDSSVAERDQAGGTREMHAVGKGDLNGGNGDTKGENDALVPLREVLEERLILDGYFLDLLKDFSLSMQNIRDSIPKHFPANIRSYIEKQFVKVRVPFQEFIREVERSKGEVKVPFYWKWNPIVVDLNGYVRGLPKDYPGMTKKCEEAYNSISLMGFETSTFLRLLILYREGDINLLLDDLNNIQGQINTVQALFKNFVDSILHLFYQVDSGFFSKAPECARSALHQISEGFNQSANILRTQASNIQQFFERNGRNFSSHISEFNKNVYQTTPNYHKGICDVLYQVERAFELTNRVGYQISATSLSAISQSTRHLNSILLRACNQSNISVNFSGETPLFQCGSCKSAIGAGPYFVCAECPSFRVCEGCAAENSFSSCATHVFLRVPTANIVPPHLYLTDNCIRMLNTPPAMNQLQPIPEQVPSDIYTNPSSPQDPTRSNKGIYSSFVSIENSFFSPQSDASTDPNDPLD